MVPSTTDHGFVFDSNKAACQNLPSEEERILEDWCQVSPSTTQGAIYVHICPYISCCQRAAALLIDWEVYDNDEFVRFVFVTFRGVTKYGYIEISQYLVSLDFH